MKIVIILCSVLCIFACSPKPDEKTTEKTEEGKFDSLLLETKEIPSYKDNRFVQHDSFPSRDSLLVFVDIYERKGSKPTVLLCHQAGFSRGEYNETAFRIGSLGFSSIAIDQRSGDEANDVINKTALLAKEKGLPTEYADAQQDIEAAIDYLYDMNENQPIILVGSSYSASLVLLIGKNNEKVKAVAAFSPGEYLKGINIHDSIAEYAKPIFVTSSKTETEALKTLISEIDTSWVNHFQPDFEGIHGSKALWNSTEKSDEYWKAFKTFLKGL